jgi:6-phosphofructokinase 1
MAAKRLAILTSGGDSPGMNAAVRAATLVALDQGFTVLGVRDGYRGLVEGDFFTLGSAEVAGILRRGGTMLGTARCPEFLERATRDIARQMLKAARINHVLAIGGNGTLAGAAALSDPAEQTQGHPPVKVVGLPASIDNDIGHTSMAIGVDTAMNTIIEACDKIADTASAHGRTFIVEVMGRDSGYLAMATSIAAGADMVMFHESGKSRETLMKEVCDTIVAARLRENRRVLVIKSEAVKYPLDILKADIEAELKIRGGEVARTEVRVVVLGHVVRGGSPSAFDRLMSSRLGSAGVRALVDGLDRVMVGWQPSGLPPEAVRSALDPRCYLVPFDAVQTETKALLDGTSPAAQWRTKVFDDIEQVLRL